MKTILSGLLLMLTLAACKAERAADVATPAAKQPAIASPSPPAVDTAPSTPPAPAPAIPPSTGPMPAPGAITFGGFGPATFGSGNEEVRMAWGKDMKADPPNEPGGCHYLFPEPRPQDGYRVAFMFEGDKFVRIDVAATDVVAPGGGKSGMTIDDIRRLYAGRVEEQNHKYVDGGKYLRIKDAGGGIGVLLFETDAAGKIGEWRIGVPPQVDYVEGCS